MTMYSKFHTNFGALHFEKLSNMATNEEKPCWTYLKPISAGTEKPDFRYPFCY